LINRRGGCTLVTTPPKVFWVLDWPVATTSPVQPARALSVYYTNAGSLMNKWTELRAEADQTETWLKSHFCIAGFCPPGFQAYRCDRPGDMLRGGALRLVADYFPQTAMDILCTENIQAV
uniref:FAD-binding oxidoreductase n=1 Tax=Echinostoma caproni TaxID=27848 RepID=A0A183BAN6_9TREM